MPTTQPANTLGTGLDPTTLAILLGLTGAGGALSNRSGTSTGTSSNDVTSLGIQTPALLPEFTNLYGPMSDAYLANLGKDTDLKGYQANATMDINRISDTHKKALEAILAQRGIQGPAAANTLAQNENTRFGEVTKLSNSIPLLQQALLQQKLQTGTNLANLVPYGNVSSSAVSSQGNTSATTPGNVLGGTFSSLGTLLAGLVAAQQGRSEGGIGTPTTGTTPTVGATPPYVPSSSSNQGGGFWQSLLGLIGGGGLNRATNRSPNPTYDPLE